MMRKAKTIQQYFRQCKEQYQADYAAGRRDSQFTRQRTGIPSMGANADYHYRNESQWLHMLEMARDMDRNDTVIGQAVTRAVNNIVQGGINPDPNTGDRGVDQELKDRWNDWAENPDECDLTGEDSFRDMEEQVCRSMFVDGDILVFPMDQSPQLQLIEAHRLRTPKNTRRNVVHGVLLSDQRKPLQYWVTKQDVGFRQSFHKVGDMEKIPARDEDGQKNIYHIYHKKRTTQTRGITAFAPVFAPLQMFEDLNYAKMVQAQIVSAFSYIRYQEIPSEDGPGETEIGANTDGSPRYEAGVQPGIEITARPNERIEGFSPNVPNSEFFEHVKLILSMIGLNIGLPLILVTLDASETNFSGWRGAFEQAKLNFRSRQKHLARRFHRPVYTRNTEYWMSQDRALARAAQRSDVQIFRHSWRFPTWPYIEPGKDAAAIALQLATLQNSPRRISREHVGADFEEIYRETVEDYRDAVMYALQAEADVKAKFPNADVHWRDLLPLQLPKSITGSMEILKGGDDATVSNN